MKKAVPIFIIIVIIISNSYSYSWWQKNVFDDYQRNMLSLNSSLLSTIEEHTPEIKPQAFSNLILCSSHSSNMVEPVTCYENIYTTYINYYISLKEPTEVELPLFVEVVEIKIGDFVNPYNIVVIEVRHPDTIFNSKVTLTFVITVNLSGFTEEEYNNLVEIVKGKTISYSVNIKVG